MGGTAKFDFDNQTKLPTLDHPPLFEKVGKYFWTVILHRESLSAG